MNVDLLIFPMSPGVFSVPMLSHSQLPDITCSYMGITIESLSLGYFDEKKYLPDCF